MCVCACDDERLSFVSEIKRVFTDMCFKDIITFMFCVNEDALTGTAQTRLGKVLGSESVTAQ